MRTFTAIMALALLLAGCSSGEQGTASPAAQVPATPAPTSGAPASTSSTPSTPTPSTPSSKPTTAKDGTNVQACRDGSCQILVSKPVVVTVNKTRLRIGAQGDRVQIETDDGGSASFGSGGTFSFGENGGKRTSVVVANVTAKGTILTISTS